MFESEIATISQSVSPHACLIDKISPLALAVQVKIILHYAPFTEIDSYLISCIASLTETYLPVAHILFEFILSR